MLLQNIFYYGSKCEVMVSMTRTLKIASITRLVHVPFFVFVKPTSA